MYIIPPEEIRKLKLIFKPYLEGCYLRKDAPKEVVDAFDKYHKWFKENIGLEQ